MKTEFNCEVSLSYVSGRNGTAKAKIIGKAPEDKPYLAITVCNETNTLADIWLPDKDVERFAVNILVAIGSKRLKKLPTKRRIEK